MRKYIVTALSIQIAAISFAVARPAAGASRSAPMVQVSGYTKSSGTVVQAYERRAPTPVFSRPLPRAAEPLRARPIVVVPVPVPVAVQPRVAPPTIVVRQVIAPPNPIAAPSYVSGPSETSSPAAQEEAAVQAPTYQPGPSSGPEEVVSGYSNSNAAPEAQVRDDVHWCDNGDVRGGFCVVRDKGASE